MLTSPGLNFSPLSNIIKLEVFSNKIDTELSGNKYFIPYY